METRVADNSAVFALLFSLLSFIVILGNIRYVPLNLTVIAGLLGVIVGAVSGFALAKRQLNSLTKTGESRVRLSTILFFIGGLFILFSLTYSFVLYAQIVTVRTLFNFGYLILPAFSTSEAILFFRWERKHRKQVFVASGWSGRLYTSPRTD